MKVSSELGLGHVNVDQCFVDSRIVAMPSRSFVADEEEGDEKENN